MQQQNYISTATLAEQTDRQPASIRTAVWRNGHFYGVRPVKLPGGKKARLLWPADAVARIVAAGEVAE
jgi:hypothetical protein